MLRKSKTELIVTPKKNASMGSGGVGEQEVGKGATGDLKQAATGTTLDGGHGSEGEQSNCVVM